MVVKQAIDRLPLFPGVFELVGIGYTGVRVYFYLYDEYHLCLCCTFSEDLERDWIED